MPKAFRPRDESGEAQRRARLLTLGAAIRDTRNERGLKQDELGVRLAAWLGDSVPQTTISRWEAGMVSLDVEQIRALETALEMPPGQLLVRGGYVPVEIGTRDVEELLRADIGIHETMRDFVVSAYRQALTASKALRSGQFQEGGRRR